ncbi:hypothetical protein LR48_Vigan05g182300 [Vigna angularis]|uniref:Uncharacterized protein n=1 Tax=Phaseolus angularis TaxID=3914 RepID=A0A0L9UN82_PHAAN|nr:hypothetical protein LR48_Vigan05g182300 [Vigna angularis]
MCIAASTTSESYHYIDLHCRCLKQPPVSRSNPSGQTTPSSPAVLLSLAKRFLFWPTLLSQSFVLCSKLAMSVCVGSVREGKAFASQMRWRLREKMDSQLGYLNWDSWFLCLGFCVELIAIDGSLRLLVRNGVRDLSSSSAGFWRSKLAGDGGYGPFTAALQRP